MSGYFEDIEAVFRLELPWNVLSECNILVTGATGLIGGCLVETLMRNPKRKYHIYASGRSEARARVLFNDFLGDEYFHFLKYDVIEPLNCEIQFDYIIHAASNGSPNFFAEKPVEVMKANFYGVDNLLNYGVHHGMKRMLYVSSGEVYGEGDGRPFSESYSGYVDCTKPRSCYPSAKRAAESLCASYIVEHNTDVVIARPCHIYGPHFTESDNRVYAQFISNVLNDENIILKSTGEQIRSWCYVLDCISALLFILLKGKNGCAYNIADNKSNISIKELAELVAGIENKEVVFDLPSFDEQRGFNTVNKSVFLTDQLESLGWKITDDLYSKMVSTIKERRRYERKET